MAALVVRTEQLEEDLANRYAPVEGLAGKLRSALGSDPDLPLDPDSTEVLGYLIRPTSALITTWLVTTSGFVVHELAKNGDSLCIAVPLWRIRRVVEQRTGNALTVTVEIDADRVAFDATGAFEPSTPSFAGADGAPTPGQVGRFEAGGVLRPAFYEAVGDTPALERAVARFARVMRAVTVGG